MAKLQEDILIVKISKLIKDTDNPGSVLTEDILTSLEAVVQELAGAGTLIEIQSANQLT